MRFILTLALLFSGSAYAAELTVDVSPSRPMVIDSTLTMIESSGTLLMGRWFAVNFYIKNDFAEPVVIDAIEFHIKSVEGTVTNKSLAITPLEIAPGGSAVLQRQYIDGLSTSSSFEYDLSLEVNGHKGTLTSVGEKIIAMKFLKTQ